MNQTLQLNLPVMLHSNTEPIIFLNAKNRLEKLGEKYGIPLEVKAFLPFMPNSSRKLENFKKQIIHQKKYSLPIGLVETGIWDNNSLAYNQKDPSYNSSLSSDLEDTLEQIAKLRDLDPNPKKDLVVAPHVGVLVVPIKKGDFSRPCFYSPEDFLELKSQLYRASKDRFLQLQDISKKLGLRLAIENGYPLSFTNNSYWDNRQRDSTGIGYQVFNDFRSLVDISRGNLVLDLSHLVAARDLPNQFARQKELKPDTLFLTTGVSSWNDFLKYMGKVKDYLQYARAIHISQVEGVGIRLLKDSPEAMIWGGGGTLPPLISPKQHASILKEAIKRKLAVNIEEDFAFNPLTYNEADRFLEPILKCF